MARSKDMKRLIQSLKKQGIRVEKTNGMHFQVFSPNGKDIVLVSSSGDPRALKNAERDLRRAGIEV